MKRSNALLVVLIVSLLLAACGKTNLKSALWLRKYCRSSSNARPTPTATGSAPGFERLYG